jgi:hypothetical protein
MDEGSSKGKSGSITAADRFLDRFSDSPGKHETQSDIIESKVDLGKLRSIYAGLPDRLKKEPAVLGHLVAMTEVLQDKLDEIAHIIEAMIRSDGRR